MKLLFSISIIIWCVGCAPLPEISEELAIWQTRQQILNGIHNWEFTGRIALQYEDRGWFARLNWQQRGTDYRIQVSGPAGQGAARLEGNKNRVTLTRNDQTTYHASHPEELLANHFGWQVPVEGLQSWVRGMPAPNEYDSIKWDSAGRLIRLNQDGWNIQFIRYATIADVELPQHLVLEHESLQVRILIDNWKML